MVSTPKTKFAKWTIALVALAIGVTIVLNVAEEMDWIVHALKTTVIAIFWTIFLVFFVVRSRVTFPEARIRVLTHTFGIITFYCVAVELTKDAPFLNEIPFIGSDGYGTAFASSLAPILAVFTLFALLAELVASTDRAHTQFRTLSEATAAKTGDDFFDSLVHSVGTMLRIRCVLLFETWDEPESTLSRATCWRDGTLGSRVTLSPPLSRNEAWDSEGVAENRVPWETLRVLKETLDLPVVDSRQYPLTLYPGHNLGRLVLLHDRPFAFEAYNEDCFQLLASRAAAEIDRRRMEAAARRSERLASLGNLAAGISHEINNPLWMIALQAQTIRLHDCREGHPEVLQEAVDNILSLVERGGRIANNVLRYARDEPCQKSHVSVTSIVWHAVDLCRVVAERKGIQLAVDLPDDLGQINGNQIELEQVFVNLISNAIQAGGVEGRIDIGCSDDGTWLHVFVQDYGKGMTDHEVSHAFDPFYTTRRREGGTGLGLSIANSIIVDHSARIAVKSQLGHGTTITVSFARPTREAIPC